MSRNCLVLKYSKNCKYIEKNTPTTPTFFIICDYIQLNQHHFVNIERSSTKHNINKRSYSKDNATGEKVPNVIKKRIAPKLLYTYYIKNAIN